MKFGKIGKAICAAAMMAASASVAAAEVSEQQVRAIWSEVATIAGLGDMPLIVEDSNLLNAWVTNGATVTVTTPLMRLLNEDEMFGVLGHEAGHAKLGHYGRTVATKTATKAAGSALGSALGGKLGGSALGNTVTEKTVEAGEKLINAGFSREMEVEADDFAVDVMKKGDRNMGAYYNALERFVTVSGKLEPGGYNDHPPDDRRLTHVENTIHKYDPNLEIHKILK